MRVTLATGLFAIGVELPQAYLARHWQSLTIMVVPTMAIGWVTSAGFMFALFPGLSYISALCISACLTPTDPVSLAVHAVKYQKLTRLKDIGRGYHLWYIRDKSCACENPET